MWLKQLSQFLMILQYECSKIVLKMFYTSNHDIIVHGNDLFLGIAQTQ